MKFVADSALCVLRLLLLAQMCVYASSHPAPGPAPGPALCRAFGPMRRQLDLLLRWSRVLHGLRGRGLVSMVTDGNRLRHLPNIQQTAAALNSSQLNSSLRQLYVDTQVFKVHAEWLREAQENVSLPSGPAGGAAAHLDELSRLLLTCLRQEPPQPLPPSPSPSLPEVRASFEVLHYSAQTSERLKVFCLWSKRVLRYLRDTHCP